MKKTYSPITGLFAALVFLVFSCQNEPSAWAAFKKCGTNACVQEVVAVKDAFLADPKALLTAFDQSGEAGEDHYIGWLYILRDSVLLNASYDSTMIRVEMQQKLIEAAKPYVNDPKLGEEASGIVSELEMLAIASELEDGGVEMATGSYAFSLPNDGGSGELKIKDLDETSLQFSLTVVGGPPAHNQGMMQGKATWRSNNVADIKTSEFGSPCHLELIFDGEQVVIKTIQGDPAACGFGNRVMADGTYKRVDDLDPFAGGGGETPPTQLEGNWVSTDDTKAEVKIAAGRYIDIYEGKEVSNLPFEYHSKCPADCNPGGETACIKVVGQDDLCYALLSVDAKMLSLSYLGRGNTLNFKRKK